MGHSGPTCGSQPHRTIYGAQWVYLWVSATQADLWGREAPLVGLSPTGRSMGHREAPLVGLSPTGPSMGHREAPLVGLSPTGRGGGRGAVGRSPTRVGRSCGAGGDPRGGRYRMGSRSTLGAPHGFRPITPREPHTTAGRRSHGRSTEIRRHLWGGDGGQTHTDP